MQLHQRGEQWQLTLVEGDGALSAPVGTAGWRTNLTETDHGSTGVPLAVSGGWTDEDTFGAEVIFLETPHRLEITCSLHNGTFQGSWRTVPLLPGPLSALRMPR